MKKTFILIFILSFISALSISCKSRENPIVTIDSKYVGSWTIEGNGEITDFTVNSSGYPYLEGRNIRGENISIKYWGEKVLTKKGDTSYSFDKYMVNFENDTKGTLSYDGKTYNMTKN